MKDSGCAFKVVDADGVRYYTSPEVLGLADFAQSLHENERDGGGSPLPLAGRIAGAVECPEAAWLAMADDMEAEKKFSCFLVCKLLSNVRQAKGLSLTITSLVLWLSKISTSVILSMNFGIM